MAIQKRNTWKILVSFPADWPDLAGQTVEFNYPTAGAADLAASGFRIRGATV